MYYNDGPEMDENMRITKCPRCSNEVFDEDADYCQICGLPLYNYCLGEPIYDDYGNIDDRGPRHKNKGNARFCKYCGCETTYLDEGVLKKYNVVLEAARREEVEDIPF